VSARTIDLEAVVDEDRAARLRLLYAVHVPRVGRLAYLLTGDAALAEDLAQEAFVGLLADFGSSEMRKLWGPISDERW